MNSHIAQLQPRPVLRVSDPDLPALLPLLHNPFLALLIARYLGADHVRYDGHLILRLSNELSFSQALPVGQSARWHHDRCGKLPFLAHSRSPRPRNMPPKYVSFFL